MPLSPSMWDVALFIGRAEIGGIVASVYLAFLLSLTMFMQMSIIIILGLSSMTKPDFAESSVDQLRDWRRNEAHHISNYDEVSGVTLTHRVCSNSESLSVSAAIKADYRLGEQYLEQGQLVGSVMCLISLISWYMTLCKEITSGAPTHPVQSL